MELTQTTPTENNNSYQGGEMIGWAEAYPYCMPIVLVNATKEKITNTVLPTQTPINQLAHNNSLANAASKNVVTLNTDTLYSQAFLDLSEECLSINPLKFN